MELTNRQEEGLKIAIARHKAGEKFTVISGTYRLIKPIWSNLTK